MADSESEAMRLLDEFMAAFNARDVKAHAPTFNYPSIRTASGRVVITEGPAFFTRERFDRLAAGAHLRITRPMSGIQASTGVRNAGVQGGENADPQQDGDRAQRAG
jgi:hypothetical protein